MTNENGGDKDCDEIESIERENQLFCSRCGKPIPPNHKMVKNADGFFVGRCPTLKRGGCQRKTLFKTKQQIKEADKKDVNMGVTYPNTPNTTNTPNTPNLTDKNYLIIHYLSKEKRPFQNIGRGLNNGVCYIATYIEEDTGNARTAVVTSDRKIYIAFDKINNQIKNDFNLHYREEFYFDVLDSTWSNSIIKKWLYENYSVVLRPVFNRIVDINKLFMVYEDPRIHICIAVDILRSYFFFLFNANSRTHIFAEPGSGKTNQCNIFRALMFNPIASPDFSSASIYRIIEGTGGTIIIDDYDDVPEDEKQKINRHIKTNYKAFKTQRSDGGRKFRPQGYDAYSHFVFNNTIGISDAITKERVVTYKLLKHKDAPTTELNYKDQKFAPIRDDLYICLLQYWKEIKDTYDNLKVPELKVRDLEIFKPQLAIAKVLGDDIYQSVLSFAKEYVETERLKDLSDDWEYLLFEEITDKIHSEKVIEPDKEIPISPNDIADLIAQKLYSELNQKDRDVKIHQLRTFIGGKLSGYTIFKKTRPHNKSYYHVSINGFIKILDVKYMLPLFKDRLGVLGRLPPNGQNEDAIETPDQHTELLRLQDFMNEAKDKNGFVSKKGIIATIKNVLCKKNPEKYFDRLVQNGILTVYHEGIQWTGS